MADLNYTISVESERARNNIKRLQGSVKTTSDAFSGLKTAIAGIAIGALVRNTLLLSDAMVNMARATGISVENITAFSQAMATSGGTADRARDAISDLTKNLGEAAAGSAELQEAFSRAGISLDELRTLSTEDIFRGVLQGLTEIPDKATRSSTAMRILGESVKGVDLDNLNQQFGVTVGQVGPYASAIESAAAAQTKLSENLNNFQLALTKVLEPLNKIAANITISVEVFRDLIQILAAVGVSFLIFNKVLPAIQAATTAFYAFATSAKASGGMTSALVGHLKRTITHLKNTATGAGQAGSRIASMGLAFSQVLKFGARLLGIVGIIYSIAEGANVLIRSLTGFDTFDYIGEKISQATDKIKEFLGFAKEATELPETMRGPTADDIKPYVEQLKRAEEEKRKVVSAIDKELKGVGELIAGYNKVNDASVEQLRNNQRNLTLSQEYITYLDTISNFQKQHASQIDALRQKQAGLNLETELGKQVNAEIEKQIAALTARYNEQLPVVEEIARQIRDQAVAMQEAAKAAEAIKRAQETARDFAISMEESTRDAQRNFDMLNMGNLEREIFQIENSIRDQVTARVRELQRVLDETADPAVRAQIQQQIDAIQKSASDAINAQSELAKQGYEYQRSWSFGWAKAFRDYQDDATNAAKTAERVFSKATRGMEDAIVGFVKTGKFEWKDFVNSILEELLRAQIQQLIAQIFGAAQPSNLFGGGGSSAGGGGGGGILGSIGGAIGSIFGGGSNKSPGMQNSNAGGGGIIKGITDIFAGNNSIIGSASKGTGIIGAIANSLNPTSSSNPFINAASSIGGGIVDTVSKVGKFFSGFFANGGTIPRGGYGIVGEAGPEMVSGPATVTPMGPTTVNYNINAVDASSFAQLLSRDPGLIYAVTEQGRKSIARRR